MSVAEFGSLEHTLEMERLMTGRDRRLRECVLDVGVRADRHGTRCRDNCSTSCGARYTPQMQFIRTRQRGALPLFSTLPTSSTHSRNVTLSAPIRAERVFGRGHRGSEVEATSRSKRGVQRYDKGRGGGWRSYCDANGAATVTLGALNVTPYKGDRLRQHAWLPRCGARAHLPP